MPVGNVPEKPRRTRMSGTSEQVLAYLKKNPNIVVSIGDVASETGLDRGRISSAISHLMKRLEVPIKTQGHGMYIYTPNPIRTYKSRDVFEFVGQTNGRIIVRDEKDELFILRPLFEEQS